MDNRSWLWRKRSSEKTILAANAVDTTLKYIDEEVQRLSAERETRPENVKKNLSEKLASVLLDCHPGDKLVKVHGKSAQETTTVKEKPEAEVTFVEKEVDDGCAGRVVNEKAMESDAAEMEKMQQLAVDQEEENHKIQEAVMETRNEFEKAQKELAEANKSLAKLSAENSHLNKALLVKEKLIEDLNKQSSQTEAEFNTLMTRLDTIEKENSFLKYEHRILEKELEIRNEEMEYTRRSLDAAHKQQLESVKQIAKLEAECERLRSLVRKKPPGPAVSVKPKGEAEMTSKGQMDMRRRKLNPSRDLIIRKATKESSPEMSSKMSLIERLCSMEEENRTLKETVISKSTELQASRMMYSRTATRLSTVEAQLKDLIKGSKALELARYDPQASELSISSFDNRSEDSISSPGSWITALISELEHFKDEKIKHQREKKVSDLSLMDDFVEMEKLTVVSAETPCGGHTSRDITCKEIVPVMRSDSDSTVAKQEFRARDSATGESFDWLQVVLNAILKQKRISKRSLDEILEDVRIAMGCISHPTASTSDSGAMSGGYITSKSPNDGTCETDMASRERSQHLDSSLSMSIRKIIELTEGIKVRCPVSQNSSDKTLEKDNISLSLAPVDYFVHVFRWNSSELTTLLQGFIHTCNDLLNGKADLEQFVEEISYVLNCVVNNCVAPKDASSARNNIKKHFGWNQSQSDCEAEVGTDCLESNMAETSVDESSNLISASPLHHQDVPLHTKCFLGNLQEENRRLKDELKNMEALLESANRKSKDLMAQLHESEQNIGNLASEVKMLKESKEVTEDQIENQKSINEDLDTQLTVAKVKLSEVFQKLSSLEVELEYKNNCCEELEATCFELQLQLESVAKRETPKHSIDQDGKICQNGWEMTAASVKLAECQETILNLSKQLKALASPRDAVLFDKVFSTTNNKKLNKRFSLRDQMLVEDGSKAIVANSLDDKGTLCIEDAPTPSVPDNCSDSKALESPKVQVCTPDAHPGSKNKFHNTAAGSLAIVPSKKRGVGLLMKLFLRRKRRSSITSQSFANV